MEKINEINADDRTVRQVLDKVKYIIDFFQREYKWQRKQIEQLIDDLTTKFLSNYKNGHERKEVQNYERYYLGPIVLSQKEGERSIIDGQQRLTSITLLLIYLNNLQKFKEEQVSIEDLIFSEKYGQKSFNLDVSERKEVIEKLYMGEDFNNFDQNSESVQNILERYRDIEELFPEELQGDALPYFIDWLIDNVIFVEIITYSDEDAYTIFETMNDRGLNLTPTEMLKGYMLSNLKDIEQKKEINNIWKNKIYSLRKISKEEDLEFFKAWLRAKYAESIRPGKKGAANEDFEKIGTRFHQWVKDNKDKLGLKISKDFYNFTNGDMAYFVNVYLMINNNMLKFNEDLESLFYINLRGLATSIFYPLLISPIASIDDGKTITKKLALVSKYLELFVVMRSINYRNYSHSAIRYTMYSLVKEIRNKEISELVEILKKKTKELKVENNIDHTLVNIDGIKELQLHGQNKRFIQFLLARITSFIEVNSGMPNKFEEYVSRDIKKPYQVEHIWADNYEEHKDEFEQRDEFEKWRNKIGALLLLPEGFNQSYGALPYKEKLPHYFGQNLWAKTLTSQCYERNPNFLKFKEEYNFHFKPHLEFKKKDIEERQELIRKILYKIYDINVFDNIASLN